MIVDTASINTTHSMMSSIPALPRPAASPRRPAFPARQRVTLVLEIVAEVAARVVAVVAVVAVFVVAVHVVLAVVVVALEAGRRRLAGRREVHRVWSGEGDRRSDPSHVLWK